MILSDPSTGLSGAGGPDYNRRVENLLREALMKEGFICCAAPAGYDCNDCRGPAKPCATFPRAADFVRAGGYYYSINVAFGTYKTRRQSC